MLGAQPRESEQRDGRQDAAARSETEADEASAPVTEGAAPGASGLRVYIDPQTGRLLSAPPPGAQVLALSPAEVRMLSRSSAGLTEELRLEGGYRVRLDGRFRSFTVAAVGGDGVVTRRCISGGEPVDPEAAAEDHEHEHHEEGVDETARENR